MRLIAVTAMSERELRLQPRLRCIADCVPRGARLADVGTDHGYLPVWLLLNGRIAYAFASDVNEAPLARAKRTAEEYGASERICFRLCDGLDGFAPGEADTIAIAGMGGETIIAILRDAPWLTRDAVTLLLQPMTKAELLRPWLVENGFRIDGERLVRDKGTIYAVLTVRPGMGRTLTPAEAWCGAGPPRDPLYGEYARGRIRALEGAAAGPRRAKSRDDAALRSLEADAEALRKLVREWENADRS